MNNIWKIYVFRFLRDFYLIVPILIPFYKSLNFSNTEILIIQAVFSLSLLLFEIPSGYFSDVLGRKLTIVIGSIAFPLGLTCYAFSSSFGAFILTEIILGFAFAMFSGTESALIYDTLLEHNQKQEYHRIEGRAEFITRIGSMLAAIIGGALAVSYLRLPFYVNILSGIFMLLIATQLREPLRHKLQHTNVFKDILRVVKYCLEHKQIFGLILLYAALMTTGLVGIWEYLIKLQLYNLAYYVNGIGFALFQASSALGALASRRISNFLGVQNSYRILLLIPLLLFMQTLANSPWILVLSFGHAFIWGYSYPFFLKEVNHLISSDIRATVLSTGSMFGRLQFVIIAPLVGILADKTSLDFGFIFLALFFLVFAYASKQAFDKF